MYWLTLVWDERVDVVSPSLVTGQTSSGNRGTPLEVDDQFAHTDKSPATTKAPTSTEEGKDANEAQT